jgi:hypothetical protein
VGTAAQACPLAKSKGLSAERSSALFDSSQSGDVLENLWAKIEEWFQVANFHPE